MKVLIRRLRRRLLVTSIAVASMAAGIAMSFLLVLFVHFEWTYDTHHEHVERIHRVLIDRSGPGGDVQTLALAPPKLAVAAKEEIPQVKQAVRIGRAEDARFTANSGEPIQGEILYADPTFFDVFTHDVLHGTARALSQPNGAVLTASTAQTLFGRDDVVGEPMSVSMGDADIDLRVGVVVADPPPNSSVTFDVIIPIAAAQSTFAPLVRSTLFRSWGVSILRTYFLLSETASPSSVEVSLQRLYENRARAPEDQMRLQPLRDVHFATNVNGGLSTPASPYFSYVLAGIAFIILVAGCVNFVSLSLAQVGERAKEVGVRKSLGSRPANIARDFWRESIFLTGIATVLGGVAALLLIPPFQGATGRMVAADVIPLWMLIPGFVVFVLVLGFTIGVYPGRVLARLSPHDILRGQRTNQDHGFAVKSLLVLQFTIAIALVAGTLAIHEQVRFLTSKDLGFETDRLLAVYGDDVNSQYEALRSEARRLPTVRDVSGAMFEYGVLGIRSTVISKDNQVFTAFVHPIAYNYPDVVGARWDAGSGFAETGDASDGVLVNEAFVRQYGWENPVGQTITFDGPGFHSSISNPTIKGVLENIHYESLHHQVEPMIFPRFESVGAPAALFLRLDNSGRLEDAIADVRATWQSVSDDVFKFEFLSSTVEAQYRVEKRWQAMISFGAFIALGIAALGLVGLIQLVIRQRTKEIGIRRTMGATYTAVFALLVRQPVMLILVAAALAFPLTYAGLQQWLQGFAVTGGLSGSSFLLSITLVLVVVVATVGIAVTKHMRSSPVHAIRET